MTANPVRLVRSVPLEVPAHVLLVIIVQRIRQIRQCYHHSLVKRQQVPPPQQPFKIVSMNTAQENRHQERQAIALEDFSIILLRSQRTTSHLPVASLILQVLQP